jgi:hypothetical protein
MPRERVAMRKVKEVLRLRYELGISYSHIRQSCKVSLGTVNEGFKARVAAYIERTRFRREAPWTRSARTARVSI